MDQRSRDHRRLSARIRDELTRRGVPEAYRVEVELHPSQRLIAVDMDQGPDSFEVHDMYAWDDPVEEIAEDLARHYHASGG